MKFMNAYKYCIDLDGTICQHKVSGQEYSDLLPMSGAVEKINSLKNEGHYIIIYTARNMLTYNNNLGRIIANQAKIVIDWLAKYNIPYDELHFGKPVADYYIDDKAIKFTNWSDIQ